MMSFRWLGQETQQSRAFAFVAENCALATKILRSLDIVFGEVDR
jgi:hypothetical protein